MTESEMVILDHEKKIEEYRQTLARIRLQNEGKDLFSEEDLLKMERAFEKLKRDTYTKLTSWERLTICRHPSRPHSIDYISGMCERFEEIHGDRLYRDDPAVITGFGVMAGVKVMIIAQEKGNDTDSRIERNFGMPHPEGYRKALRAMKLAEKFDIPVISLIDTTGAYCGISAEERGQGWAIAENLLEMARIKTPIICMLIGEGCSGGALGVGIGDEIAILEHAYYTVITPEACASILWKDTNKKEHAAESLKMHAESLKEFGIVDSVIPEPLGGAHHDKPKMVATVKEFILRKIEELSKDSKEDLLEKRYQKFRKMGRYNQQSVNT